MGRPCPCCVKTSSSSADGFYICVLGQVVDVGPLRSEKNIVIQAAWRHQYTGLGCDDPDGVQQIDMTLSYDYDTEVMTYSYEFGCSVGDPDHGGESGSGAFSIKPPGHSTIECHTENLKLVTDGLAQWPFITCNAIILNEDCVPVGCGCLLTHLCLKMIRDETLCEGGEYPWNDQPSWDDYMNPIVDLGGPGGNTTRNSVVHPMGPPEGCGGCSQEKDCLPHNGPENRWPRSWSFHNFMTPTDWENDKFIPIKVIQYATKWSGGRRFQGTPTAVPYIVLYGHDLKLGFDMDPCYLNLKKAEECCPDQPQPPERKDDPCAGIGWYDKADVKEMMLTRYSEYPDYDYWRVQLAVQTNWPDSAYSGFYPWESIVRLCDDENCDWADGTPYADCCPPLRKDDENYYQCACRYTQWAGMMEPWDKSTGKIIRGAIWGKGSPDCGCEPWPGLRTSCECAMGSRLTECDIWDYGEISMGYHWDKGRPPVGDYDYCEVIDEGHDYLINSENAFSMPWYEFKTDACIDAYRNSGDDETPLSLNSVLGIHGYCRPDLLDGIDDATEWSHWLNYALGIPTWCWFSTNRTESYSLSFIVSWASSTDSDDLCGGGGTGTGGDGPLEIDEWDEEPQNFSWTQGEFHFETDSVSGGTKPYSASLDTGTLPDGLSVSISNSGSLKISGTTDATAGAYLCTIKVLDTAGNIDVTDQITITVQAASGTIKFTKWERCKDFSRILDGYFGEQYLNTDNVTGGQQPYQEVEVISGALPSGLGVFINNRGTVGIIGIPGEIGKFTFKLRATDALGNTGDSKHLTLYILQNIVIDPGGGPGQPSPLNPEGIIAPGETVNYPGPTIISPPSGSLGASGLRFSQGGRLTFFSGNVVAIDTLPSGLHLNPVTGAVTGIYPSGGLQKNVAIICQPSGLDNSTAVSGLGVNVVGGSSGSLGDTFGVRYGLQFNTRPTILPPSGNVNVGIGYFTQVWDASTIEAGDLLLSVISDADGTPDVNYSSGWNIVWPSALPPTGNPWEGAASGIKYWSEHTTRSGVADSYGTVCLWKIATTGDAAYGIGHAQTVGAGLISSIGLRKPSGSVPFGEVKQMLYDDSQERFEIDPNNTPLATGIAFISGVGPSGHYLRLPQTDPTITDTPNLLFGNSRKLSPYGTRFLQYDQNRPKTSIYVWWAKSTTDFQTIGGSGVTSSNFTLNKHGKNAGTFPSFANPLSMMIAISNNLYNDPGKVSPISGSPTGCNILVLECT